ncbi:MAG TPA: hypothetical protein VMT20_08840 [Terriglobia bacterium]|nr:hypothetical protein [Terriglobia bacterium]
MGKLRLVRTPCVVVSSLALLLMGGTGWAGTVTECNSSSSTTLGSPPFSRSAPETTPELPAVATSITDSSMTSSSAGIILEPDDSARTVLSDRVGLFDISGVAALVFASYTNGLPLTIPPLIPGTPIIESATETSSPLLSSVPLINSQIAPLTFCSDPDETEPDCSDHESDFVTLAKTSSAVAQPASLTLLALGLLLLIVAVWARWVETKRREVKRPY